MPLAAQELQLGDGECTRSGECRPICNPEIENPMMRFELSSFSPLFADKILLTSLPCRYRGELSPKPELRQIFGVARKLGRPEVACACLDFGAIRTNMLEHILSLQRDLTKKKQWAI